MDDIIWFQAFKAIKHNKPPLGPLAVLPRLKQLTL
jgi:hypothetical protein